MMRGRDRAAEGPNTSGGPQAAAPVRDRLNEAITELRRLTDDQLAHALEQLSDVDDIHDGSSVESVRRIRVWSAGYLRLAAELEAAARYCRLVEQELRVQIDAPLAGSYEQFDSPGHRRSAAPDKKSNRAIGLHGWLKALSGRSHPVPGPHDSGEPAFLMAAEGLPVTPSAPSIPAHCPEAKADVAAFILGPLEVSVAGRRVLRWNSLKARAVFQYLLIHRGRPVRRDVLMELQWPDHTHTSARNNLNVALYSLRNTLDGPRQDLQPVLYQDGCYVLNPGLKWWVDRDEFLSALSQADIDRVSGRSRQAIQHYRRAVQLYRGPLFEDDLSGDWYLPEQRHLTEVYLQAG